VSGRLNLLGGKIEAGESAAQTAARECWEESGRLLDQRSLLQRVERSDVSWHPQAKYALHFLELSDDNEADVCERYAAARAAGPSAVAAGQLSAQQLSDCSEMEDLHWVDLSALLRFLDTQRRRGPNAVCDDPLTTTTGARFPVISFSVCMLNQRCVRERLERMLADGPTQGARPPAGLPDHPPAAAHAQPRALQFEHDKGQGQGQPQTHSQPHWQPYWQPQLHWQPYWQPHWQPHWQPLPHWQPQPHWQPHWQPHSQPHWQPQPHYQLQPHSQPQHSQAQAAAAATSQPPQFVAAMPIGAVLVTDGPLHHQHASASSSGSSSSGGNWRSNAAAVPSSSSSSSAAPAGSASPAR
jgi:8-oxo-dGTP pyrophosphatase MutT (NUDIX family)